MSFDRVLLIAMLAAFFGVSIGVPPSPAQTQQPAPKPATPAAPAGRGATPEVDTIDP